jgi:hypothetical protein
VESYPEATEGRSVAGSFLHNGTVSMFERQGLGGPVALERTTGSSPRLCADLSGTLLWQKPLLSDGEATLLGLALAGAGQKRCDGL